MNGNRETSALIGAVAKLIDTNECKCGTCDERRVLAAERIVGELQSRYLITPLAPSQDESRNEWRIT